MSGGLAGRIARYILWAVTLVVLTYLVLFVGAYFWGNDALFNRLARLFPWH